MHDCAHEHARTQGRQIGTHLERDMIPVNPHFQLLPAHNVLFRPCLVVLPIGISLVPLSAQCREDEFSCRGTLRMLTYLTISLSLMIRLNSSATAGDTYTCGSACAHDSAKSSGECRPRLACPSAFLLSARHSLFSCACHTSRPSPCPTCPHTCPLQLKASLA